MANPATGRGQEFLFLGNQVILDFLNTRPVVNGDAVEMLPDFSSLLQWFEVAGLLTSSKARTLGKRWDQSLKGKQALRSFRELRETLRQDILAWEDGRNFPPSTVALLNRLMERYPMKSRLIINGGTSSTELWCDSIVDRNRSRSRSPM
jgi:hypothetical protein